ncbi:MAG: SDR family NAD(P)-dependent oxidoreductase [Myxococcales bacterium]|nr:SDR family NAD(P)-dependent oxidoreductase [Myxococcales bacterium]
MGALTGRVALVAGATRGAGRGIAVALGEAGATVYCTGRTSEVDARPEAPACVSPFELKHRPETIEETARMVAAAGGRGIPVQADHSDPEVVAALAERIDAEAGGLDILVNDIWGGETLAEWGTPAWKVDVDKGRAMFEGAVMTHIITARHMIPLLLKRQGGLLVEITDGDALYYRGTLFYDLVKTTVIRLAFAFAEELRDKGVTSVAVTPGFLRSEAMLEHMGTTEDAWQDGAAGDPHFMFSETPRYVGRGIAALAADPERLGLSGQVLSSWALADRYAVTDLDGSTPHWGRHAAEEDFGRDQRAGHRRFLAGFVGVPSAE